MGFWDAHLNRNSWLGTDDEVQETDGMMVGERIGEGKGTNGEQIGRIGND